MSDTTAAGASRAFSSEQVAQFEKLAAHAGFQFRQAPHVGACVTVHHCCKLQLCQQRSTQRMLWASTLMCVMLMHRPGVTEAILESLAAGVPPNGLATVLDVLSKRQAHTQPSAAAGTRDRSNVG